MSVRFLLYVKMLILLKSGQDITSDLEMNVGKCFRSIIELRDEVRYNSYSLPYSISMNMTKDMRFFEHVALIRTLGYGYQILFENSEVKRETSESRCIWRVILKCILTQ
jgi:hypothetical protein